MAAVRTLARITGWLLTPFVAWAASFLGASVAAGLAAAIPNPRTGLLITAGAAVGAAVVAIWAWLGLLRRSPELRETLQVTEEGTPVAVEEPFAAAADENRRSDDAP
ncbi:MAG TPA: hypothetical protein VLA95_09800 [Gemmatimonadales bacterium]|nr:hypothetical protein [Gemmatimonadales bacterium]